MHMDCYVIQQELLANLEQGLLVELLHHLFEVKVFAGHIDRGRSWGRPAPASAPAWGPCPWGPPTTWGVACRTPVAVRGG